MYETNYSEVDACGLKQVGVYHRVFDGRGQHDKCELVLLIPAHSIRAWASYPLWTSDNTDITMMHNQGPMTDTGCVSRTCVRECNTGNMKLGWL